MIGDRRTDAVRECPMCGAAGASSLVGAPSPRMVRCRACRLAYRDPLPAPGPPPDSLEPDHETIRLEERVADRRSHEFRRLLARAGRPGRVLDVGTGFGYFLRLAGEAGWDAVGVDVDEQAVHYARTRLGVNALASDLHGCRFPDASFDLVTLWNVLEFVATPLQLLEEVRRVAKPGGGVFIRTQNLAWQLASFRAAAGLKRLGLGAPLERTPRLTFIFNTNCFSRTTLALVLERTGLEPLSIRNSPPVPGDPYLGLGTPGELVFGLVKRVIFGAALAIAFASVHRWLVGPSLEAWGRPAP